MKNFFVHNYKIKIISVLLATGLWWFVYVSQNPRLSASFPVTIKYENLAPEFKLETETKTVRVELHGDSRSLENVGPENLQASVDLEGLEEGSYHVGIKINNRTGLRMQIRTKTVDVRLTPLKKIELPVALKLSGELKEGYRQGEVTYKPMSTAVYGGDSALKIVAKIVAAVDVGGSKKSFRTRAALRALDSAGATVPGVHLSPDTVMVYVAIESAQGKPAPVTMRFKDPEAQANYPTADYYPREVLLGGDPEVLKKISAVYTEEFDLGQCAAGGSYQVKLKLPPNVTADSEQITFSCDPEKGFSRTFSVVLRAINLCSGCDAIIQPAEINVTVTGRPDVVNSLTQAGVTASVDLLGMKPGEREVSPYAHLNKANEQIKLEYPTAPVKAVITKSVK
ncbi:MAG: CdaR family protein [bacterium]